MPRPSPTNALTASILASLFQKGCFAWRQSVTGIYDSRRGIYRPARKVGIADIIGCRSDGRFIACEVKTGKDRLRSEQEGFLSSVKHAKGIAMVVRSLEDFENQYRLLL